MENPGSPLVRVLVSLMLVGGCLLLGGCATSSEATRARQVAASKMPCEQIELSAGVERETQLVREWIVGCDFRYTRVHCTQEGCYQAPPKPPCVGDLPCFQEDPVTLHWKPSEPQERAQR